MMRRCLLLTVLYSSSLLAQESTLFVPNNQAALKRFAEILIDDDALDFKQGEKTSILNSIEVLSAQDMSDDYQHNAAAADKKYLGKIARITSVVSKVTQDAIGYRVIVAKHNGESDKIQLYINDRDDSFANIKDGDNIDAICIGLRVENNQPTLGSCVPVDVFLDNLKGNILRDIANASQVKYKPLSQVESALVAMYKPVEWKLENPCLQSTKLCYQTIMTLNNTDYGREQLLTNIAKQRLQGNDDLPVMPIDNNLGF